MYCDFSPRLIGFQVLPPSSVRNAPAAEMAMKHPLGIGRVEQDRVQAHAAGARLPAWAPSRARAGRTAHASVWPPSVERNSAASSTPAYTVSGSVSDGSRCQTRLNSQGCGVPSYHWCVPGIAVVGELVAHRLPGLAAVVGALDQLPEPAARLRRVDPVRDRPAIP